MKYPALIAALMMPFLCYSSCSYSSKDANAAKPEITRCQEELNTIPEIAAGVANKTRGKHTDDAEESLSGMEIALTINRMFRSTADPDQDQDDWCYKENSRENFERLVNALKSNSIPPTVDFLAGESLDRTFQEEWLRSGNLIGTLSYRGLSPKKGTAQDFIDTLAKNEEQLAPLWSKFPRKKKYFRYPSLKLGMDAQRPKEIRAFLKQNDFIEVPATIDARGDYFSQPYCAALSRGDKVCANLISATFKSVLLERTQKARAAARTIVGRDVKQILMLQANQLTSDLLDDLLRWYMSMGVRFISIDDALTDPFYAVEDVTNTASQIIWETKRKLGIMSPEQ